MHGKIANLKQCKKYFSLICGKVVQFIAIWNHLERGFVIILKSSSPFSSQALQEQVEVSTVENNGKMLKHMVLLL